MSVFNTDVGFNYDRSQDNIVRVNATELRRRIETYFVSAGVQEPLLLEIPRGSYCPVFRYRSTEASEAATIVPDAEPAPGRRFPLKPWTYLWPALCLLLGICCLVLLLQNHQLRGYLNPWTDKPAVALFWKNFLGPARQQTDIVLPDDSASVIEDMTGAPVNLGDYVSRNFIRRIQSMQLSDDRRGDAFQVYNHNLVTFGAIRAAQVIQAQIPGNSPHQLVWTRFYGADDIKRNNVVLIGGKKSDPWNQLFDGQINFITDYDDLRGQGFIRNRHPKLGEPAEYREGMGNDDFATYSVIAYLPNPGRSGHALILAGIDSDATAAAAEFVCSEEQMKRLRNTLHLSGNYPFFEVLLKTPRLSGTSFRAELVAYRTYPNL
ncbi:hypothetical protein ACOBR2_16050 [Telmatobacter bradus]|uniref:hypothetical protein n=1 Tax=Telmatobacter bradus TaxID=474953 RepID=UPI003B43A07F